MWQGEKRNDSYSHLATYLRNFSIRASTLIKLCAKYQRAFGQINYNKLKRGIPIMGINVRNRDIQKQFLWGHLPLCSSARFSIKAEIFSPQRSSSLSRPVGKGLWPKYQQPLFLRRSLSSTERAIEYNIRSYRVSHL